MNACKSSLWKQFLVWLAYTGVVLPFSAYGASPLNSATPPRVSHSAVVDIKMSQSGGLTGQLVNADNSSLSGQTIVVRRDGAEVARATSDGNGHFGVTGLKGGAYTLETAQGTYACRVWDRQSAPPAAAEGILLVDHSVAVRGQMMADACNSQCAPACGPAACGPAACGPAACGPCDPCGNRCSPFGFLANPWVIGAAVAVAIAVPLALDDDDDAS